jgi:hypothetical protein
VYGVPESFPAAERAKWLAELSDKLGEARHLVTNLDLSGEQHDVAQELDLRIQAALREVHALRLGRSPQQRDKLNPEWSKSLPWASRG